MGYFPFYIDIENKSCVVIGGGCVAFRKIEKLLPFNPNITVIAPDICQEIYELNGITLYERKVDDSDVLGAFMVISATGDRRLNEHIFKLCKKNNIMVNTVDDINNCGFIFPAIANKGKVTAAVTTSGESPLYASYLRKKIESILRAECGTVVETLSKYRMLVKNEVRTERKRKEVFQNIFELCVQDKIPSERDVRKIIEDLKDYDDKNRNQK